MVKKHKCDTCIFKCDFKEESNDMIIDNKEFIYCDAYPNGLNVEDECENYQEKFN